MPRLEDAPGVWNAWWARLELRILRGTLYFVLILSGIAGLVAGSPGAIEPTADLLRRGFAWLIFTIALGSLACSSRGK